MISLREYDTLVVMKCDIYYVPGKEKYSIYVLFKLVARRSKNKPTTSKKYVNYYIQNNEQ
jgi:hypothetical protein